MLLTHALNSILIIVTEVQMLNSVRVDPKYLDSMHMKQNKL